MVSYNNNNNPWLLNAQFKSNGKLFNDNAVADASADPSGSETAGKKYGIRRHLPDAMVDKLGLTNEEMTIVQAELAKVDGTPVMPYQKPTGLNRYLPLGMQANLGKLAPEEQTKVDEELAKVREYSKPRQVVGDTFQSSSATPSSGADVVANPYEQFNPTMADFNNVPPQETYPTQQPEDKDNAPSGNYGVDPSQQSQQMTPEQAQMLQQMLAGGGGGVPAGTAHGAGGVKGMAQNAGSTALSALEKGSEGLSSLAKSTMFGNPDITLAQGAATVGAAFVIANAGGLALNKLHGYDFAGGMSLTDEGAKSIKKSPIAKLAQLVDKVQIGFKGADGKSFSAGYLDGVKWMPDTVKRVLGNNQALVERKNMVTGETMHGDVKQYFNTFFDHMFGKTVQNADGKFVFENRGMVGENGNLIPPRFRELFEGTLENPGITAERLFHIKNLTYNPADSEMMGHMTHKLLEQVSATGWGEGFFSAKDNVFSVANRETLVKKLLDAHNDLKGIDPTKVTLLPDGIELPTLLAEKANRQVSEHLQHLFKAEVVEHAFKMDETSGELRQLMEKPFKIVQTQVPAWSSEAQLDLLKKKTYGFYGKDLGAQNPRGIAHDVPKVLHDLEKGILPTDNWLGKLTNGVKGVGTNVPFSNEARQLFWKEGWDVPDGKRDMLLAELKKHEKAFELLYGKDVHAKNLTALQETKSFYQFQDIVRSMKHEGKFQLDLGWKAGEFVDNIISRAKQMCAEDTGPRVMTAKAVENMNVSGLGRIVPTFTHWFKNMWVGNPFEHLSGLLETAHFSNQEGKGLEKLGKAVFGSGSIQNRIGRLAFMFGAMMAFTQSIGASFKERNPKFTTMPPANGKPEEDKPTAVMTSLPQMPLAIGSNIASAAGVKGLGVGGNMMAAKTPPESLFTGNTMPQSGGASPMGGVAPRKVTETAEDKTKVTTNPAQAMVTVEGAKQQAYNPNIGDMSRAFGREFISAGLGFMVFTGLFNSINTQTQWLTKAMGRFGPQTFKWLIPFAGPLRMNWLGAAINLGGGILLMPVISNAMLKVSDAVFGKPQYIKVEEATKKQEEAKRKADDLAKKQQKALAKAGGLPQGFNPAMLASQSPTVPYSPQ
jgi:hypothetical protein